MSVFLALRGQCKSKNTTHLSSYPCIAPMVGVATAAQMSGALRPLSHCIISFNKTVMADLVKNLGACLFSALFLQKWENIIKMAAAL